MRGERIERADQLSVYRCVWGGIHNLRQIGQQTGMSPATVREIVFHGVVELYDRLREDRRRENLDNLCDGSDLTVDD